MDNRSGEGGPDTGNLRTRIDCRRQKDLRCSHDYVLLTSSLACSIPLLSAKHFGLLSRALLHPVL